jgi:3-oxoacyl-[acyl-carrier-protein] synthase III
MEKNIFETGGSIWGNKPKSKKEVQLEFEYTKTREQEMKEISEDATKQVKSILDEVIKRGYYTEEDIKNIVNQASWIEKI